MTKTDFYVCFLMLICKLIIILYMIMSIY